MSRYQAMFTLTHDPTLTHTECTITWYSFHSDALCNDPIYHPGISYGTLFTLGHNIRIETSVGFPLTKMHVKAITRGLVTACTLPIFIEVCGHERVTLLNPNKQIFQFLRVNATSQTTTLDVTTMFKVFDSINCPIISHTLRL